MAEQKIHLGKFINNLDSEDLSSEKLQGVVNNVYAKAVSTHKKKAKEVEEETKEQEEDTVTFIKSNHDRLKAHKNKPEKDIDRDDATAKDKVAKDLNESLDDEFEVARYNGNQYGIWSKTSKNWMTFGRKKDLEKRVKELNDNNPNKKLKQLKEDIEDNFVPLPEFRFNKDCDDFYGFREFVVLFSGFNRQKQINIFKKQFGITTKEAKDEIDSTIELYNDYLEHKDWYDSFFKDDEKSTNKDDKKSTNTQKELTDDQVEEIIDIFNDEYENNWDYDSFESAGAMDKEEIAVAAIRTFPNIDEQKIYDLFWDWAHGIESDDYYESFKDNKLKEDIQPGDIHSILAKELPAEDIDHHNSDLYVRKTPKSTEIINKLTNKSLLSTFKDNIDGDIWYELPFCYTPYFGESKELTETVKSNLFQPSVDPWERDTIDTSAWVKGTISKDGAEYQVSAKVFNEPSQYGINHGRISKLWVKEKGYPVAINYDRGWVDAPPHNEDLLNTVIKELEDYRDKHPISVNESKQIPESKKLTETSIPRNASKIKVGGREFTKNDKYWSYDDKDSLTGKVNVSPKDIKRLYGNDVEVLETDPNYKSKRTKEVKVLQGNYGYGWDDLVEYDKEDSAELKQDLRSYRENEKNAQFRVVTRRVPLGEDKLTEAKSAKKFIYNLDGRFVAHQLIGVDSKFNRPFDLAKKYRDITNDPSFKKGSIGAKHKSYRSAVNEWVKTVEPAEFIVYTKEESPSWKDDSLDVYYKKNSVNESKQITEDKKIDLYVNGEYVCSSTRYKRVKDFVDAVKKDGKVTYAGLDNNGKLSDKVTKTIKDTDKVVGRIVTESKKLTEAPTIDSYEKGDFKAQYGKSEDSKYKEKPYWSNLNLYKDGEAIGSFGFSRFNDEESAKKDFEKKKRTVNKSIDKKLTRGDKRLTETEDDNITIETSTSILDMFYPSLYQTIDDYYIPDGEWDRVDDILANTSMEFAERAIRQVFPRATLKFKELRHPREYNYSGENIIFDVTLPRADYESVKEDVILNPGFEAFLKKNSPRSGYIPFGAYTIDKFKTQDDMYSIGQIVKFMADDEDMSYDFDEEFREEISNNFETYDYLWEEVMDWLREHDQAYQDFLTHFHADENSVIDLDSILGWISDHDTLTQDFEREFGISLGESLNEAKIQEYEYTLYNTFSKNSFHKKVKCSSKEEAKKIADNELKKLQSNGHYKDFIVKDVKEIQESLKEDASDERRLEDIKKTLENGKVIKISKRGFTPTKFCLKDGKIWYYNKEISIGGWNKHPEFDLNKFAQHATKLQDDGFIITVEDESLTEDSNSGSRLSGFRSEELDDIFKVGAKFTLKKPMELEVFIPDDWRYDWSEDGFTDKELEEIGRDFRQELEDLEQYDTKILDKYIVLDKLEGAKLELPAGFELTVAENIPNTQWFNGNPWFTEVVFDTKDGQIRQFYNSVPGPTFIAHNS